MDSLLLIHLCRCENLTLNRRRNGADIKSAVFDDLAQEAVITARKNLGAAADLINAKKDKSTDAKLFLVRHLLILKEMTAGLELGRKDRRKEWQGITGTSNATWVSGQADLRLLTELVGQCKLHAWIWTRSIDEGIGPDPRCEERESSHSPTNVPPRNKMRLRNGTKPENAMEQSSIFGAPRSYDRT